MARSASTGRVPGRREDNARETRDALIDAGLELFAKRGYAAVGTEEIVKRARVTRGALYHHFADKRDLFRAVHERVEEQLVAGILTKIEGVSDPWEVIVAGTRAFLDSCTEPAVKQIGLVDAPAVLGWAEWREVDERYGLGLMKAALGGAMEAGVLRTAPLDTLSHLMLGALAEAAFVVANAEDPDEARAETEAALLGLVEGMRV
ncbi:MAG TPA: TetR/AcrR family transcriptional regulator [Solirubrobacterales bacterium]|jgi:AcrR family transcriptional regulator|nr:TetR/AcrR family transcriptional regulator [Solirubrobacterales bacterium]